MDGFPADGFPADGSSMDDFSVDPTNDLSIDDFDFDALGFGDLTIPFELPTVGAEAIEPLTNDQGFVLGDPLDLDLSTDSFDEGQFWSDAPTLTPDETSSRSSPNELGDVDKDVRTYDFRIQAREHNPEFATTWMDQDDSGNYEDRQTQRDTTYDTHLRETIGKRKRENAMPDGQEAEDIPTLNIVLTMRSESTKLRFAKIVSEEPSPDEPMHVEKYGGHRLRRRDSAKVFNKTASFLSGLDLAEDLLGHPYARGCQGCLKIGFHCSLLDDEETWPCHHCADDNHDCTLITPPAVKNSCDRCRRLKTPCSFRSIYDQGEACRECMDSGHRCYAGPAKDFIRPRIRADWDPPEDPYRIKKALKLIENPIPVAPPDDERWHEPLQDDNVKPRKDQPLPSTTKVTTMKIKTKFCHPIHFNHIDKTSKLPCHFCAEPSFPILGLAEKEVSVIELKGGQGLKEVNGGHKDEGVENTRVCLQCTTERMQIIMCTVSWTTASVLRQILTVVTETRAGPVGRERKFSR